MPKVEAFCEICSRYVTGYREEGAGIRFCSMACTKIARERGMVERKNVKHVVTPEAEEMIRKVYAKGLQPGDRQRVAKKTGIPAWKVSKVADRLGIARPSRIPNPPWSDEELELLHRNAHKCLEVIVRIFRANGFRRSPAAIKIKKTRNAITGEGNAYNSRGLAQCLGVDDHFVQRAIKNGRLKSSRRGTNRTEAQGGDMYQISPNAVREYLVDNIHEIDLAKVDKYWFVDIVANGRAAA